MDKSTPFFPKHTDGTPIKYEHTTLYWKSELTYPKTNEVMTYAPAVDGHIIYYQKNNTG